MERHERRLVVTQGKPVGSSLHTPCSQKHGREVFFGEAHIKKNHVSYHLMPVYMCPDLVGGNSDGLRKRMQGKSCFNFKSSDKGLFAELARLTESSVERVKREGLL